MTVPPWTAALGAIVAAGLIIGAAILITGRWAIAPRSGDNAIVYRLDRWTGQVEACFSIPFRDAICKPPQSEPPQ